MKIKKLSLFLLGGLSIVLAIALVVVLEFNKPSSDYSKFQGAYTSKQISKSPVTKKGDVQILISVKAGKFVQYHDGVTYDNGTVNSLGHASYQLLSKKQQTVITLTTKAEFVYKLPNEAKTVVMSRTSKEPIYWSQKN